jgi:hypothetical protein
MLCLAAAVLATLLLLSKVGMNLKSLVKDVHWMRRVRALVERLAAERGITHGDSVFDSVYDVSMSNYAPSAMLPPAHLGAGARDAPRSSGGGVATGSATPRFDAFELRLAAKQAYGVGGRKKVPGVGAEWPREVPEEHGDVEASGASGSGTIHAVASGGDVDTIDGPRLGGTGGLREVTMFLQEENTLDGV